MRFLGPNKNFALKKLLRTAIQMVLSNFFFGRFFKILFCDRSLVGMVFPKRYLKKHETNTSYFLIDIYYP